VSDRAIRSEEDWLLLLDALVSYADACTLPQLTPSCPFYEMTPDGPRCREECRDLAERLGGPARPVTKLAIGGLVMKGRLLPLSAAAGYEPYDAGQRFVAERTLEPSAQSTASLLLGLRAALRTPIVGDTSVHADQALTLWRELARRGLPVERVVRGALLHEMARAIAMRAVAPHLVEADDVPSDLTAELRASLRDSSDGWPGVLSSAVASWESHEDMLASIAIAYRQLPMPRMNRLPQGVLGTADQAEDVFDGPDRTEIGSSRYTPELQLAFSSLFISRIEEWLSRLLEDDLMAVLCAAPPPASVLLALPARAGIRDEVGLWIWERLTHTHLDEWSTSSLLLEWRMAHGEPHENECPRQVLAERRVEPSEVSDLALERMSSNRGRRAKPEGLNAGVLTESAVEHLRRGRWQAAADVFAGLVALRPTDGDAWNNLGFCQLPGDRLLGLRSLEQASLYERRHPFINSANRALALHLVGRDDDALRISDIALAGTDQRPSRASLWRHTSQEDALELLDHAEPRAYLAELRRHIAANECEASSRSTRGAM
jgi:tetratricopeptide (TPR) repeat protein